MGEILEFGWIKFIFLRFVLLQNEGFCSNNGVENEVQLFQSLQEGIPKYSPPLDMEDSSVYLFTDLMQILSLDEKKGAWEIKIWIYANYISESASWNSTADSEDLPNYLVIPQGTFWKPEIVVNEIIEVVYDGMNQQFIFQDGKVLAWSTFATLKLSCLFDASNFPYDKQTCSFVIAPFITSHWQFNLQIEEANMVKDGPNLLLPLQYYKENDQWELIGKPKIDLVPKIPQRYPNSSEIVVTISMQRRPEFYNVALVFPFGIIYLVSTLTFLIPVESGEKISFSVTILLAQMIFYGTLLSILPASSLHVANAFPQMVFVFAHLSLNCLASVIVVSVHHKGKPGSKVWLWVSKLLHNRLLYIFCLSPIRAERRDQYSETSVIKDVQNTNTTDLQDSLNDSPIVEPQQKVTNQTEYSLDASMEWEYFAIFLDRLFLAVHVVIWIQGSFSIINF
ncbi:neuronal acetylcholine receptor subunit alpha-7-like isoform X1 [Symsagittifera roscoffensis]|uniref:neuronal acetylcholine receptor subunit alpha-7-like isoform X1 n=1 Tax=Symsagittifera roscoffensis TaxID=84072 RepID=UPI00307C205B